MRKEVVHQKQKRKPLPPPRKAKARRELSPREPHVARVERTPDGTIEENTEEAAP